MVSLFSLSESSTKTFIYAAYLIILVNNHSQFCRRSVLSNRRRRHSRICANQVSSFHNCGRLHRGNLLCQFPSLACHTTIWWRNRVACIHGPGRQFYSKSVEDQGKTCSGWLVLFGSIWPCCIWTCLANQETIILCINRTHREHRRAWILNKWMVGIGD